MVNKSCLLLLHSKSFDMSIKEILKELFINMEKTGKSINIYIERPLIIYIPALTLEEAKYIERFRHSRDPTIYIPTLTREEAKYIERLRYLRTPMTRT